ncbi:MAG: MCE family protein [Acidobacteriota bacterium]
MRILLSRRERLAGVFLLATAALALAFVLAGAMQRRWFEPRWRLSTVIQRGEGLRPGSPVLLSGIDVGRIGTVELREDGRVEVELVVLARHGRRLGEGTRVVVRRLAGIGEKRLHLQPAPPGAAPLREGAVLAAEEPVDLLDALTTIDVGRHLQTVDRAMVSVEGLLARLSEQQGVDRLLSSLDRVPDLVEKLDRLLGDLHAPLVGVLGEPALTGTLRGADALLNDPATVAAVHGAAAGLERQRLDRLLARSEAVLESLEEVLAPGGHLRGTLAGADRVLADERLDRLLVSLERLAADERLPRLLEDLAVLARQGARVGPEIPVLAQELLTTLREAVIVLKALQASWPLAEKARRARQEVEVRPTPTRP